MSACVCMDKFRSDFIYLFYLFILFCQNRVSVCSCLGCSGNFFVDYAVLELREIYLPLPRAGIKGVHHHLMAGTKGVCHYRLMAVILKRSTWGMDCKVDRYYLADYANRVKECPCLFFLEQS